MDYKLQGLEQAGLPALIRMPLEAAMPEPTMTAVGAASPTAQGHAMTSTLMPAAQGHSTWICASAVKVVRSCFDIHNPIGLR